jgi:glycosyltransferase involved in cell wall biosynthesis
VIEHGVIDPGHRYTGELSRAAVVINEPVRRGRMVGADLLPQLAREIPLDLFGMPGTDPDAVRQLGVTPLGDIPQELMHAELARRRVYLHPVRWTSLGLSLIEAMMLGMPIVAVAATEVVEAVPADAGVVSTRPSALRDGLREFLDSPEAAALAGKAARAAALERYGVARFLADWDALITEVTR